jgi:serine O-acetyltransferase
MRDMRYDTRRDRIAFLPQGDIVTDNPEIKAPMEFDAARTAKDLMATARDSNCSRPFGEHTLPQPERASELIDLFRKILFFGYIGTQNIEEKDAQAHVAGLMEECSTTLTDQIARSYRHDCKREHKPCDHCTGRARAQAIKLMSKLPLVRQMLDDDVQASYDGDPAAQSYDEIIFAYPGFAAITVHRIAHELYDQGVPLLPRLLSEVSHGATGIDIHPGAHIGQSFFIDHGTGVVIGETTVIGDNVKIYQGATLGAMSFPKDACGALIRDAKRHPTLEDHVTVYAGATILGGDTIIGKGSIIGGSVWLTHSVPPGTKVVIETPRLRFHNSPAAVKDKE